MRSPIDQIFPGLARQVIFDALHGDAAIHRTNQRTEIAADTLVLIDARNASQRRV
jgi:hypothetical protein